MPAPLSIKDEIKQSRPFASASQEAVVALLRTASDVTHSVDGVVEKEGLTQAQYNVLRILRGADGPLPTMDVADRMVTPTPGITRLISRLDASGFVTRTQCGEDRRRMLCSITEKGLDLLDRLDPSVADLAKDVMRRLSGEDIATLLHLLDEVREGVRTPTTAARPPLAL